MTDIAFNGVSRGDQLVTGKYYRLTFGRRGLLSGLTTIAGTTSDPDYFAEAGRVYDDLPKTGLMYPVSPGSGATPTGSRFVIDVKPASSAIKKKTVAELASAAQQTCDRFGFDAVELLSVEAIKAANALTKAAAASRDSATTKAEASTPDNAGGLGKLVTVAYWLVIILLVSGAAFAAWKVYRVSKVVT